MKRNVLSTLVVLMALLIAPGAIASPPGAGSMSKNEVSSWSRLATTLPENPVLLPYAEKTSPTKLLMDAMRYTGPKKSAVTGNRVMVYQTLASSLAPSGGLGTTTISATGTPGEYIINNFWEHGFNVKMQVTEATGAVKIPCQQIATIEGIGRVNIGFCTETGALDSTQNIVGTIDNNGNLTITSWWGVYAMEGDYAGKSFGWYYNTGLLVPNGTMHETRRDGTSPTPTDYSIVAAQSGNVLSVLNFANHGQIVELLLTDTKAAVIEQQLAAIDIQHGKIYTSAIADGTDGSVILNPTITTAEATDLRNIKWTDWTLRSSTAYFGYLATGSITTDFDLKYPEMSTSLEGEGTQSNPWLIKSIADLSYLGRQTAADATAGKYYAIANDIDMSELRFQPIGSEEHPFRGIIDGRNFTLKKMLVERSSEGHAGLFGYASAESEIRNIRMEQPRATSTGRYNAALVGWSDGLLYGCEIMSPTIGSDYAFSAGLAGHANKVEKCHVYLGSIIGTGGFVAGMVSELAGNMSECYTADCIIYTGTPASGSPSGGLVALAKEGVNISDSYFTGVVSGRPSTNRAQRIGGIVGEAEGITIERCFSIATLENYTNEAMTGGIGGVLSGTVQNCYSAGRVICGASAWTGGLVGYVSTKGTTTLANCYTYAETIAGVSNDDTSSTIRELLGFYQTSTTTLRNLYYDNCICRLSVSNPRSASTSLLTGSAGIPGYDSNIWLFQQGYYPRLRSTSNTVAAAQGATAIQFAGGDHLKRITKDTPVKTVGATSLKFLVNGKLTDTGRGASIDGTTLKLNGDFATDTLVIRYNPTDFYYHVVQFAPKSFEGEGTSSSPYLISSAADMDRLAQITTEYRQPFTGTFFRLDNDIDMAGDTIFSGIGLVPYSTSVYFNGTFDGNGHAIKNLKMGGVVWTTKPTDDTWKGGTYEVTKQNSFVALFGTLGRNAVVQNLTLDATCNFEGGSYISAFSTTNSGTIKNCRNYATVRSVSNYAAGFSCTNSGNITDCVNAGFIHANGTHAAGFVATNYGSLTRVANVGEIWNKAIATVYRSTTPAAMYAGGIVAYNNGKAITDAMNGGLIDGTNATGGIVGSNNKYGSGTAYNQLIRCLNYGDVISTTAKSGSIVGEGSTAGTVQNVYWDEQILPILPNAGSHFTGMAGMTTSALTSGTAPEGFAANTWTCTAGMYPCLKVFVDEPMVKAAAQTVVTLGEGQTIRNITSSATLAQASGLTWSLSKADAFKIEGNNLVPPATITAAINDVLTAVNGNYTKVLNIARVPALSLDGNGTEVSPYQIKTADDWNTLANYVATNKVDMAGQYVKVMNDIDFTDKTFTPISGSQWNAVLLGNNHQLKGINYTYTAGKMGAIQILGPSGVIRDLTIDGTFTQTKATYAGGFVGEMYGQAIKCINRATITGNKSYRGGIAAIAYEGAVFTDCANYGNIIATTTSAGYAAGICSELKGYATFTRCHNYGKTSGGTYCAGIVGKAVQSAFIECANHGEQDNDVSFWGGIIGSADGLATIATPYILQGCYNDAEIKSKGNTAGLIATAGYSNNPMIITDCYNTGDITSQGTVGNAAGLFVKIGGQSRVSNCYNKGNVTVLQSKSYAAGIMKESGNGAATNRTIVENCINYGKISAQGCIAAGIVAQSGSYITYTNCANEGDIEAGTYSAGGILGNNLGSAVEIENCRNEGNVTIGTYFAGGIAGNTQTNVVTISGCVNTGDIKTKSEDVATGYGIGGIAGCTGATITDTYNTGNVSGAWQVGGLVGQTYAKTGTNTGTISLTRCYNTGKVNCVKADGCGPLIGINYEMPTVATYWSNEAFVTETYYLPDLCTSTLPQLGLELTLAQLAALDLGGAWVKGDNFTLPVLAAHYGNDKLKLQAITLQFSDRDTEALVTRSFNAGCPENVVWTSDNAAIRPDGTRMHVTNEAFTGKVTLTATCGSQQRQFPVYITKDVSVNGVDADAVPVSIRYFTTAGVEVPASALRAGETYISISRYANGTTRSEKFIARNK